jgi:hypothetical protein
MYRPGDRVSSVSSGFITSVKADNVPYFNDTDAQWSIYPSTTAGGILVSQRR